MKFENLIKLVSESRDSPNRFYHGSTDELPIGTILKPRTDYEKNWENTDFYWILENFRPEGMLAHKDSVFMCDNPDDVDAAGGGTEYLFEVQPLGIVEKHDLNWSSEISMLVSEGADELDSRVEDAAYNYWHGVPHPDETLWEYLTPAAKIISVEEY